MALNLSTSYLMSPHQETYTSIVGYVRRSVEKRRLVFAPAEISLELAPITKQWHWISIVGTYSTHEVGGIVPSYRSVVFILPATIGEAFTMPAHFIEATIPIYAARPDGYDTLCASTQLIKRQQATKL